METYDVNIIGTEGRRKRILILERGRFLISPNKNIEHQRVAGLLLRNL